jgi:hypothetical protein
VRTTKGKPTNASAIVMPKGLKAPWIPNSASTLPNQPFLA